MEGRDVLMLITSGKISGAQKVVLYGPEGIGKSTFASQFPSPVFCDTEGSTKHLDVRRTPKPLSWTAIMEQVKYFIAQPSQLGTFVLDTADWAERLCTEQLCAKSQKTGIEDWGYGKGYIFLAEEYGKLLDLLTELVERGVNVVITAHAQMRKFEQPDEMGAYDRWELKLSKKIAPLVKEWADMVLFANYKTLVINVDGQGTDKGKNKAQGGKRVLHTAHHPCWDAKNRHDLPSEMPMDYAKIAHLFTNTTPTEPLAQLKSAPLVHVGPPADPIPVPPHVGKPAKSVPLSTDTTLDWVLDEEVPPSLAALLKEHKVKTCEIRNVVFERGQAPTSTPFTKSGS